MQDNTFTPLGPCFKFDNTAAVQPTTNNNQAATSYRVRNLSTSAQGWFAWVPQQPQNAAPSIATLPVPVGPVIGTPVTNQIGMPAAGVETFCLPPNAWFIASAASSFEIIAGEGM